jgi:hypothetical protein
MAALDDASAQEWDQLAQVLDARVDDLSREQQDLAVERARRRIGAGGLDADDEHHLRVVWDELRAAALRAMLDRLVSTGRLEIAGVALNGHLIHSCPPAG